MAVRSKKDSLSGFWGRAVAGCSLIFSFLFLFIIAGRNVMTIADDFRKEMSIQVYFDRAISPEEIAQAQLVIRNMEGISEVKFISSEDALKFMQMEFGSSLFSELQTNPLPPSFEIKLDRAHQALKQVRKTADSLRAIPNVTEVDYAGELLGKVERLRELVIYVGLVFLGLISLAATAVVSNAAQILYFREKEKIEVMRMLGATDFYMARPLIIKGTLIGVISALIAILISLAIYLALGNEFMRIEFVPVEIILAVMGWAGLWGAYGGYSGYARGRKQRISG